jgi:ABC-type amino acid transport system permease subunit
LISAAKDRATKDEYSNKNKERGKKMDLAKIIRLVAVLFAVVAGLVAIPQSAVIIAVLGLVAGYFVDEERRVPFLVATLTLAMVAGALGSIPFAGEYLTDILESLSSLFNAAAITVIVVTTIERVKP